MIEVKVMDLMPDDVMKLVKELRSLGYAQGIHFDFEYHRPKNSDQSGYSMYNRYTIFRFYKEELATWFSLRYQ